MSILPKFVITSSIIRVQASASLTSPVTTVGFPPVSSTCFVDSAGTELDPCSAIFAPASANASAIPNPSPREEPVTKAVFPCKSKISKVTKRLVFPTNLAGPRFLFSMASHSLKYRLPFSSVKISPLLYGIIRSTLATNLPIGRLLFPFFHRNPNTFLSYYSKHTKNWLASKQPGIFTGTGDSKIGRYSQYSKLP